MITGCIRIVLVGSVLLSLFTNASADELLDQGLAKMAAEIRKFIDEEKLPREMIVGDFSGAPRLKASGGVEIGRCITEQLEKSGIRVHDEAHLQLLGKFKLSDKKQFPEDEFNSLALEIEAMILDSSDDELVELPISVFGSIALQIAGQTVDLPAQMPESERQKLINTQIKVSPTKVDETHVKPSSNSHFAIEILVANANRLTARSPKLDSLSRAFVELHHGEEYVVRIHNNAIFDAGVSLAIDGVDMFVDAKDAPPNSRLIVFAGKHIDVPGWYITHSNTKAFEISGYEDSVAKRVGNTTSIGTITATFRACWDPNSSRPADEPGGAPKGGKATKQGRDLERNYVELIRDFGQVRSIVSVRYDR